MTSIEKKFRLNKEETSKRRRVPMFVLSVQYLKSDEHPQLSEQYFYCSDRDTLKRFFNRYFPQDGSLVWSIEIDDKFYCTDGNRDVWYSDYPNPFKSISM